VKDKAKKAGKFYKEKLKPIIGPYVKKGLDTLLTAGETALAVAQPELAPAIGAFHKYAHDPLVDVVGKTTGAYGLHLTERQMKRLMRGHRIQLKSEQLAGNGGMIVAMHAHNAKRLAVAKRLGKGTRLELDHHERDAQGEGLREFLKKARKVYNESGLHKHVAPHLKKGFRKVLDRVESSVYDAVPSHYREDVKKVGRALKQSVLEHGDSAIEALPQGQRPIEALPQGQRPIGGAIGAGVRRKKRDTSTCSARASYASMGRVHIGTGAQMIPYCSSSNNPYASLPPPGQDPVPYERKYAMLEEQASKIGRAVNPRRRR
jgi:hypothetical protein